jgi:hypothetical protein
MEKLLTDVWDACLILSQKPTKQQAFPSPRPPSVLPPTSTLALMREALAKAKDFTREHPEEAPYETPSPEVLEIVRAMEAGTI